MDELNKEKRKSYWLGLLIGVLISGAVLTIVFCSLFYFQASDYKKLLGNVQAGVVVPKTGTSQAAAPGTIIDSNVVSKVDYLYKVISNDFLFDENIDTDKMRDAIYRAIFDSLDDPYSMYYTAQELYDVYMDSEGTYFGIGSYVSIDEATSLAKLVGVFEDSPASRAGLRNGDLIYKVDGEEVVGLSLDEIVSKMKGPENTDVVLTIIREGVDNFDVTVTRGKVSSPTVSYEMRDDGIGYIQIQGFEEVTTNQFKKAYDDLNSQDMKALIIDLRANGGGIVDTAVDICNMMLPKGVVAYTLDKYGNREEYTCKGETPISIPVVVLTNGYTASASELMVGAIRDFGVGISMGTKTFGKGIVQSIVQIYDGSGYRLTRSRYYTPNGVCIHDVGIEPDIEVPFDAEAYYDAEIPYDNQLEAAHEYLKNKLNGK